jgi:hypothetical protein
MAKKTYTREFKLKAVRAVESDELRSAQACREYQIAESVMNRWRPTRLHRCMSTCSIRLVRSSVASLAARTPSAGGWRCDWCGWMRPTVVRGIGHRLMLRAEDEARQRDC